MWRPTPWSSFVAVVLLLNFGNVLTQTGPDDDPYNINRFNDLRLNEPENLCQFLKCLPPVKACPEGSFWTENVAMYGCCGGCVRYITDITTECTGSMDPIYGGGYCDAGGCPDGYSWNRKAEEPMNSTSFKASLRTTTTAVADDNIIESSWCGYGLQCTAFAKKAFCETPAGVSGSRTCGQVYNLLDTFMKSGDYDDYRDDYLWLPDCTLEGLYKPKQCKGPLDEQRCVCVDPNGRGIYGSAYPFQEELYNTMNCGCSRRVWEQQQNEGIESPTLHCLENGNYEPLQCENGYCYCIDPNTTVIFGPTVPEKAMFILPCYNDTLLGQHNKYLRYCDSENHAHSTLGGFMREKGYSEVPLTSTKCDADGSYSGLQCDGTCNCVNKTGSVSDLEGHSVKEAFGCNCIRDRELLLDYQQTFKPTCRGTTGGYYDYHSDANGAYCVDEHGIRSSPKVKEKYCVLLGCNAAKSCQENGQVENDVVKNCDISCAYHGDPAPPCVYFSYQGDMSACNDLDIEDGASDFCTDRYHGNE